MEKALIEKELNISVRTLEGGFDDSREYSVAQMKNRVEAFVRMIKASGRKKGIEP